MLGVLALAANQKVSVDRLVELMWDDDPPRSARAVVHSRMSELRAALARLSHASHRSLRTFGDGYVLEINPDEVDAHLFQRLVGMARAEQSMAGARSILRRALDLWRGPMLGGWLPDDSHAALCQEMEAAGLTATEELYEIELKLGNHRAVADELLRLSSDNLGRELLAAHAMVALDRSGRTAEALGIYDRCRRWLAEELGVDPSAQLQRLNLRLLRGDGTPPSARSSEADGQWPTPIEGPTRPSHGVATSFEPNAAATMPSRMPLVSQLPADVADFVGREEHLDVLRDLLRDSRAAGPPIVTVNGPPGSGKTALAVHVAHQLRPQFPDGQLFIDLRGYSIEPPLATEEVLHRFLHALGFQPDQIPGPRDEISKLFRSALDGRRILLVLDNAINPEQVRPLLPGVPSCAVIVTSRDRLLGLTALEGARQVTVGALTADEGLQLLSRMLSPSVVEAEPKAAADLAELCAHLPLALRIATANLAARPGRAIASYVAQVRSTGRLRELCIEGDDQAAVDYAIDLSYQQLEPDLAGLFRLLGRIANPDFDVYAAAASSGLPLAKAQRLIDGLVNRNLIELPGPDRYRLSDLVREYARGQMLAHGDIDGCAAANGRWPVMGSRQGLGADSPWAEAV